MKRHLVKRSGKFPCDDEGFAVTYCNMHSEEWSEDFGENVEHYLVDNVNKCTCKNCLTAYKKQYYGKNNVYS